VSIGAFFLSAFQFSAFQLYPVPLFPCNFFSPPSGSTQWLFQEPLAVSKFLAVFLAVLTDDEHPCQILADLLTIREKLGTWDDRKIAFVGDGFSNMTRSWMWAAKRLGFELAIASPPACQPPAGFLAVLAAPNVSP
jgi:hypothetical protein